MLTQALTQTKSTEQQHYQTNLSSYNNIRNEGLSIAYDISNHHAGSGAASLLDPAQTRQQTLNEVLAASNRNNSDALVKLYDVFENEAKRIAHRLHDESAQMLALVYLELNDIARDAPAETANRVHGVFSLLDEVCSQLRNLSHELRPIVLDQLGLMPALKLLIDGVQARSAMVVDLKGDTGGRLDPAIETVIYRTVQEALNNACRHANAGNANVQVWRENDAIYCAVSDTGDGFNHEQSRNQYSPGLGLIGIQERARALGGNFDISSQPGFGTTLQVAIPL